MWESGLPVEVLLFFTILIWGLCLLVLTSSPKNKVNQWCCITGILLSVGVLKEYIYYSGFLAGRSVYLLGVLYDFNELMNSILTAMLYYITMPCAVICGLYFSRFDRRFPKIFPIIKIVLFFPVVFFGIVYPWSQTRSIPASNSRAYTVVAVYNLLYGVFMALPVMGTLIKERKSPAFRQRRLMAVLFILPIWFWLISIFGLHLLGLEKLYKIWQGNVLIIFVLFVYYLYHLFHEGIWGMRLSREHFDWSEEGSQMPENTRYIVHMLKNEVAKLRLGEQLIRDMNIPDAEDELDIIRRSVDHIEEFTQKCTACTGEVHIEPEQVDMKELFELIVSERTAGWGGRIELDVEEKCRMLSCDYVHMRETLGNLVDNALDAMGEEGTLTLSYRMPQKGVALIGVSDTGHGIDPKDMERVFQMYYSGYSDSQHFGMGLSYCQNVVKAHGGYIQLKSSTEEGSQGTEFILCLPQKRRDRRKGNE